VIDCSISPKKEVFIARALPDPSGDPVTKWRRQ
jgi:hypothetical protein